MPLPSIATVTFVRTVFVAGSRSFPHFTTSGSAARGSVAARRKAKRGGENRLIGKPPLALR
jgi:hypothetical protein